MYNSDNFCQTDLNLQNLKRKDSCFENDRFYQTITYCIFIECNFKLLVIQDACLLQLTSVNN